MEKARKYISNKLHDIAQIIYDNPPKDLERMQEEYRILKEESQKRIKGLDLCNCDFAPCKHVMNYKEMNRKLQEKMVSIIMNL